MTNSSISTPRLAARPYYNLAVNHVYLERLPEAEDAIAAPLAVPQYVSSNDVRRTAAISGLRLASYVQEAVGQIQRFQGDPEAEESLGKAIAAAETSGLKLRHGPMPALICVIAGRLETCCGTNLFDNVPSPSCPCSLSPHVQTVPSAFNATPNFAPAAT